nr:hypothetical protein [Myxococcota bacterium]
PLPRDRELAVARALVEHPHPLVRAWALKVAELAELAKPVAVVRSPSHRRRGLTVAEHDRIATCDAAALALALAPALEAPVTGLCAALAPRPAMTSVAACAALLGCDDPLEDVARQLDRFAGTSREHEDELDRLTVVLWQAATELPPLAHARLWRWEAHDYALARWLEAAGDLGATLERIDALPGRIAARTLWTGIAEVLAFLRYRDVERFRRFASDSLASTAAVRVGTDVGVAAARIVMTLVESGAVPLAVVQATILDRAADADGATREHLARIARLDGIPQLARPEPTPVPLELMDEVRACSDPDRLVAWCAHPRRTVVQEAVLGLLLLGEVGQLRLAELLARLAELPAPVPVLASIGLWDSAAAIDRARAVAAASELPPEHQFHLCLGLHGIGDTAQLARAFAAVRAPADAWFRRSDWAQLVELAAPMDVALELVDAPHHHAYQPAVRQLLDHPERRPAIALALRRFLEVGADRPLHLRRDAARCLLALGDASGLPVLIDEIADDETAEGLQVLPRLAHELLLAVADGILDAGLIGGEAACSSRRMLDVMIQVSVLRVPKPELEARCARLLEQSASAPARRFAATQLLDATGSHPQLGRVAEVFAWGVRRGVELTGRLFRVHMTSAERDFGYTHLEQSKIYVSALPMLRGEPNGRDIVEGLVLHELGHHRYHRGEEAQRLWKQAHAEGLGHLLNLVADEHLERNLRGVDRSYGDRLKRLGAYAFQHATQEIAVKALLACLRGSTVSALLGSELEVAFDEAAVRLRRGAVLSGLDRAGHSLARFARALRLGHGNRHDDPQIAQALALCGKDLRKLDMPGLYALTQELAALFGGAIAVAQVFGGPEGLRDGERDGDVFGAGLDDEILQREVERILDPRRSKPTGTGKADRLQINVNPDEEFERITTVHKVRGDVEQHGRLARQVSRHSLRLRALLEDLGLRYEPARARTRGHMLDRSRLRALVTRNDPRILIARAPVRRTDLFLGTLIDCSSSMTAGDNIERARQFAALIAEAVSPLAGVEARFFGFTDSVIFDAGDARDCGVTGLVASGGNNDAAGLYHAANVAAASRRRARILVMISDGLPTQCSVAAVRGLVSTLTRRRGIVCAQVAVRPLEEECFRHRVLLDDDRIDVAVARFGRMIGELARRVLAA